MFDEILSYEKNIIAPIDIMLMKFKKYNFACLKEDLVACDDTSSAILEKNVDWGLDSKLYSFFKIKL